MSTMSCFWQRRSLVPVEEGTIAFFPFRARDLWLGMLSAAVSPPPIEPYPRSRAAIRLLPAEIFLPQWGTTQEKCRCSSAKSRWEECAPV
jgi:hypothetical protein